MAKATKADVVKAWSDKVGREDQYDVREVENFEGDKQVQLIDKDTGSVTVAVNGTDSDAYQRLVDNAGVALLDAAITPKESSSEKSEVKRTSRGNLASPTQPVSTVDPSDPVVVDDNKTGNSDVPTSVNPVTGGSQLGNSKESK